MLKLKPQYFGHLLQRANSLEKILMLEKIEGRRRRGRQRMKCLDGITEAMSLSRLQEFTRMDKDTWCAVVNGVAKSQTQWATELNWTELNWLFLQTFLPSLISICLDLLSWNSGKVLEAKWSLFPVIKNWGTQKGFGTQEHHKVLFDIIIPLF